LEIHREFVDSARLRLEADIADDIAGSLFGTAG
jgi:hypothetical protein